MAPNEKAFSYIDGTPTYYIRGGSRQHTTFYCTNSFYNSLVSWIRDLRWISSQYGGSAYSTLELVTSAGAYVNKPGQHGQGTAIDIDEIKWNGAWCRPYVRHHADGSIAVRRRYLALDAVCRRHHRFVLDGWYNAAHEDHIHMDFGGLPSRCVKSSSSDCKFVQAICNNFVGTSMPIDGAWGSQTQSGFNTTMSRLNVSGNPHTDNMVWREWLTKAARHGFANVAFGSL